MGRGSNQLSAAVIAAPTGTRRGRGTRGSGERLGPGASRESCELTTRLLRTTVVGEQLRRCERLVEDVSRTRAATPAGLREALTRAGRAESHVCEGTSLLVELCAMQPRLRTQITEAYAQDQSLIAHRAAREAIDAHAATQDLDDGFREWLHTRGLLSRPLPD